MAGDNVKMGFIDDLRLNAKNSLEIKKIQEGIFIDEQSRKIEFKKSILPFIDVIREVCMEASRNAIYISKNDQRIIKGYICIYQFVDGCGDWRVEYLCNAYKVEKKHIFSKDEYHEIIKTITLSHPANSYCSEYKYQKLLLDFITEQIPEIFFENINTAKTYIPSEFYFGKHDVIFSRRFSICF